MHPAREPDRGNQSRYAGIANQPNLLTSADLPLRPISDAVDGAVVIVRQQHRAVFQPFHINRSTNIVVVLDEAGDEGLYRVDRPIGLEVRNDDVAADLMALVPRTVAGNEDRIAV